MTHAANHKLHEKLAAAAGNAGGSTMKVRFQADADLNEIIVEALLRREPSIDFCTATAAYMTRMCLLSPRIRGDCW